MQEACRAFLGRLCTPYLGGYTPVKPYAKHLVSWPVVGSQHGSLLSRLPPRARSLFEGNGDRFVRHRRFGAQERAESRQPSAYMDEPLLIGHAAYVDFARELYVQGVVRFGNRCKERIG